MAPGPVYLYNGFKKRGEISIIITRFSFACRRLHKKKKKKKRTGDVNQPAALPAQATHSLFFFFIWLFLLLLERENNHNQQETRVNLYIQEKRSGSSSLSVRPLHACYIFETERENWISWWKMGGFSSMRAKWAQPGINEKAAPHTQQTRRQQQQVSEPPRLL